MKKIKWSLQTSTVTEFSSNSLKRSSVKTVTELTAQTCFMTQSCRFLSNFTCPIAEKVKSRAETDGGCNYTSHLFPESWNRKKAFLKVHFLQQWYRIQQSGAGCSSQRIKTAQILHTDCNGFHWNARGSAWKTQLWRFESITVCLQVKDVCLPPFNAVNKGIESILT